MTELRGVTWDHPRGYAGLERATAQFSLLLPRVRIEWARHSLHRFESHPIADLAAAFDLIVLDHPCVGDAWKAECLVNLDEYADDLRLCALAHDCVGRGMDLYRYGGGLWALPIDAACHVAAYRHDLLPERAGGTPRTLRQLRDLVCGGMRLVIAFRGVHGLMTFLTLCAVMGYPPVQSGEQKIVPDSVGLRALEVMQELLAFCPPDVLDWASIDTLNAMSERDDLVYCPYGFGFAAYSDEGFASKHNRRPLTFTDVPGVDGDSCQGAIIGGAGLAVSRRCPNIEAAVAFLSFVLEQDTQKAMALALGQPVRRSAWQDAEVNTQVRNFYHNTLAAIDHGYLRPRYPGYVRAQYEAGQVVESFLRGEASRPSTLAQLNILLQDGLA